MAGVKFQSFGAATIPLSKVVIDNDLLLYPHNATFGNVAAKDLTIEDLSGKNVSVDDITCRDIVGRKATLNVIATPADTQKQLFAGPYHLPAYSWGTVITLPIPDGYLPTSGIRLKFKLTAVALGTTYTAYAQVFMGRYSSPVYSAAYNTSIDVSLDLTIGNDPILIKGYSTTYTSDGQITNLIIACDEKPGVVVKPITWQVE